MPGYVQSPSLPGGAYGNSYQLPTAGGIYSSGGGQTPSAGGSLDIGDLIAKYGPLALAAYGLISSGKSSGKADQYLQSAILSSQGDYMARQPLRTAGIANLSALPDARQLQTALANPSNPFAHPILPEPPMFVPTVAGTPEGEAARQKKLALANGPMIPGTHTPLPPAPVGFQRPTLSIGPDGLPLPPRGV